MNAVRRPGLRVIVAGTRTVDDESVVAEAIEASGFQIAELVNGGQRSWNPSSRLPYGADYLAARWAQARCIPVTYFRADWNRLGRAAGPIRNGQMARYGQALVAIWDGKSAGTRNMIEQAREHGLPTYVHMVLQRTTDHWK